MWCDVCQSWVKSLLRLPPRNAPGTPVEIRGEWHVCPCCHWRRRHEEIFQLPEDLFAFGRRIWSGTPTSNEKLSIATILAGPSIERCVARESCPGDCGSLDIINALRRLAGVPEITAQHPHEEFDLRPARESWRRLHSGDEGARQVAA